MPRNPVKKQESPELPPLPTPSEEKSQNVQVVEREVTLSLLNDKINYLTNVVHKIAEACECDTSN